jgi:hypothetical protein
MDRLTARPLADKPRSLGFPKDLASRIDGAIERRNALVHLRGKDIELARAATGQGDLGAVTQRVVRLELDCPEQTVELAQFALPKLLAVAGNSPEAVIDLFKSMDPSVIADLNEPMTSCLSLCVAWLHLPRKERRCNTSPSTS